MKLIFFGSGDFAAPVLTRLISEYGREQIVVVTQPDRPAGRHGQLQATPIKQLAQRLDLICQETLPTPEQIQTTDLGVVVDYGKIIPSRLFEQWPLGILNIHPSLLPRYRGPAPIQWALLQGEGVTGVSIMRIDRGVDTGPLLAQQTVDLVQFDTSIAIEKKLAEVGVDLLIKLLPQYIAGELLPQPQPVIGVSYAPRLTRLDGQLLPTDSIAQVWNKYRALQPWPGIYFEEAGKRIKITEMRLEQDRPVIVSVQPAGKRSMTLAAFKQGHHSDLFAHIL